MKYTSFGECAEINKPLVQNVSNCYKRPFAVMDYLVLWNSDIGILSSYPDKLIFRARSKVSPNRSFFLVSKRAEQRLFNSLTLWSSLPLDGLN